MNRLLAIETSGETCSVALCLGEDTRWRHELAPMGHAELLLPFVHDLLAEADVKLGSLDAIVFGRGPGSFTSLRIGTGVVQGLAWGADLPVVPVSSLAAVARQLLVPFCKDDAMIRRPGSEILVAVDARMNEVFHCSYRVGEDGNLEAMTPEGVTPPHDIQPKRPEATIGAGNGFERYTELQQLGLGFLRVEAQIQASASALIPLARQWLKTNKALPAIGAQPQYVRNQVAEKSAK